MTFGSVVKHFFPMNEAPGAQILTDAVAGVRINANNTSAVINDASPGLSKRIDASVGGVLTENGPWFPPLDKDFALIACYQAWADNSNPDYPANAGMASTFLGTQNSGDQLKLQPYYAGYCNGSCYSSPFYDPMIRQVQDQDYIIALVKRTNQYGSFLEHYVDNVYTGAINISALPESAQTEFNSVVLDSRITLGHGAYGEVMLCQEDGASPLGGTTVQTAQQCIWPRQGAISRADQLLEITGSFYPVDGNAAAVAEQSCIYYGIAFLVFENGAPDDFKVALPWLKTDWTTNSTKSMWPAWNTLGGDTVSTFRNATAGARPDGSEYLGTTQDADPDGAPGVTWNDRHLRMRDVLDYAGGASVWTPGSSLNNSVIAAAGTGTPPDATVNYSWNQIISPWVLIPFIIPRGYYPSIFRLRQGTSSTTADTCSWAVYDAESLELLYSKYQTGITFTPSTNISLSNDVDTGQQADRIFLAVAFGEDTGGNKRTTQLVATQVTYPLTYMPSNHSMIPGASINAVALLGSGPIADWQNPPSTLPATPASVGNDPLLANCTLSTII